MGAYVNLETFSDEKTRGSERESDDKVAFAVHCFQVLKGYRQSRCWAEIVVKPL